MPDDSCGCGDGLYGLLQHDDDNQHASQFFTVILDVRYWRNNVAAGVEPITRASLGHRWFATELYALAR